MNVLTSFEDCFSAEIIADALSVSKRNIESWAKNGKLVPSLDPNVHKKPYKKEQLMQFPQFQAMFNSSWDQQERITPNRNLSLVELFAGAGGLALGLEKAGFKSVLLNEKDKFACQTLKFNRPKWNVIEDDIANVDFTHLQGKVDLLTGGFPCQPFSYAGKQLGFEDIRGTLVFEMARAIKEIQPKVFLAENVKGLAENDDGKTLETIISILEEIGYEIVEKDIYKALFYKTPQKRERLIIIGVRKDLVGKATFEKPSPYHRILNLRDAFKAGELYENDVPESVGQKYPQRKAEIMSHVPEGGYWRDLPLELQIEYMKGSFHLGGGKTGMARRLSWDEPSLTLTCAPAQKQTERCHPSEDRPLTTREYARIQTFPDNWIFQGSSTQIYKQIGNAVPVNLAFAIGKSLVKMLNQMD
ncbi:DNA cytosine methyltransferase [Acinetobacter towneri]|uniref:DNA cytosine methyltransferase n=1 Tax=Acinetobacter towneri TaxID=202956 RepID=UPI0002CF6A98|nr:DNA (cytosine-5-)-methyltransferase [Acinetobacter towneri]ENV71071.1 modification methylase PspPI [Acinetobacter towneri DSM 14962 = CIP 107472]